MRLLKNSTAAFALTLIASLSVGLTLSAGSTTAFAGSSVSKVSSNKLTTKRSLNKRQVRAKKHKFAARGGGQEGKAWDKFCEIEFGRGAHYPDSGMLDWCLSI